MAYPAGSKPLDCHSKTGSAVAFLLIIRHHDAIVRTDTYMAMRKAFLRICQALIEGYPFAVPQRSSATFLACACRLLSVLSTLAKLQSKRNTVNTHIDAFLNPVLLASVVVAAFVYGWPDAIVKPTTEWG
jgi:hypothetical protein